MFALAEREPRLIHGLPFREYQALDALNISALLLMDVSPLHFRHGQENPRPDTEAFTVGRALHTLVLEKMDAFEEAYSVCPFDFYQTKEAKAWREEQEAAGKTPITKRQARQICGMRLGVFRNVHAAIALLSGWPEVTLLWVDEEFGIPCKARLDWLKPTELLDLKTTRYPTLQGFSKSAFKLDYHTRLAWYQDGLQAVTGEQLPVSIMAVEKKPPHDCSMYSVPPVALAAGRRKSRRLMGRLVECMESDRWPGPAGGEVLELEVPAWIEEDEELELTMDGESIDL